MTNISSADYALLQRRTAAPQMARLLPGGVIFCAPGRLVNALNRLKGAHWTKETKYRSDWHDKVSAGLVESGYHLLRGSVNPRTPKLVTIHAHVAKLFDSKTEGLRAACKPIPDALKKFGIIDDDGDTSPHEFAYTQVVDANWQGVEVTVRTK